MNDRHHRLDVRARLDHEGNGQRIAAKVRVVGGLLDAVIEDVKIPLESIEDKFADQLEDETDVG